MERKSRIFVGMVLLALGFAAGTLFGPAQAQTYSVCKAGAIDLTDPGLFRVMAKQPGLKFTEVEKDGDHIVYIRVGKR